MVLEGFLPEHGVSLLVVEQLESVANKDGTKRAIHHVRDDACFIKRHGHGEKLFLGLRCGAFFSLDLTLNQQASLVALQRNI